MGKILPGICYELTSIDVIHNVGINYSLLWSYKQSTYKKSIFLFQIKVISLYLAFLNTSPRNKNWRSRHVLFFPFKKNLKQAGIFFLFNFISFLFFLCRRNNYWTLEPCTVVFLSKISWAFQISCRIHEIWQF